MKNKNRPLSPRHERFAAEFGKGDKSATDAVLIAYPNQTRAAAAVSASRLLKDERIRARVREHAEVQIERSLSGLGLSPSSPTDLPAKSKGL